MRLFCFPFAGGSAAAFFGWKDELSPALEVIPIEYPGRGSRWHEAPPTTVDTLIEAITDELRPRLDRPYALLGHSFGALVAFEVAKRFHQTGAIAPVRLFVSAARAPHILPREPAIHALADSEFLAELVGYGGVPEEILNNPELLSLMLPIVRHDFRLFEQYQYPGDRPLPVPISAFGGLQDKKVLAPDVLAWSRHTTKSFRVQFFAGDHFFLNDQQTGLPQAIRADLVSSPTGRESAV